MVLFAGRVFVRSELKPLDVKTVAMMEFLLVVASLVDCTSFRRSRRHLRQVQGPVWAISATGLSTLMLSLSAQHIVLISMDRMHYALDLQQGTLVAQEIPVLRRV